MHERIGLLALLLSLVAPAASAQVALPLSVHVEDRGAGPVVSEAYVEHTLERANRWLRPAGVCLFVASRHRLGHGDLSVEASRYSHQRVERAHRRSIPLVFRSRVRNGAGEAVRGHGRSGRAARVVVARDLARPHTVAHEVGHVLELAHSPHADAVMHDSSPEITIRPRAMSRSEAHRARRNASRLAERLGSFSYERCAGERPLTDLSAVRSGHPILFEGSHRARSGRRYVGEYLFGVPHGRGADRYPSGYSYVGEMRLGRRHGFGTERFANGNQYTGEFHDGQRHGRGEFRFADGRRYVGALRQNRHHGSGSMHYPDGRLYVGEYRDGDRHGVGVLHLASGDVYRGRFRRGDRHGRATYYDVDSNSLFVGRYDRGDRTGTGRVHFFDSGRVERRRY